MLTAWAAAARPRHRALPAAGQDGAGVLDGPVQPAWFEDDLERRPRGAVPAHLVTDRDTWLASDGPDCRDPAPGAANGHVRRSDRRAGERASSTSTPFSTSADPPRHDGERLIGGGAAPPNRHARRSACTTRWSTWPRLALSDRDTSSLSRSCPVAWAPIACIVVSVSILPVPTACLTCCARDSVEDQMTENPSLVRKHQVASQWRTLVTRYPVTPSRDLILKAAEQWKAT